MASRGLEIWVSWTSFQKSNISCSKKLPTRKVLKFNMIFHDSAKINFVSKHQNKAEFKNMDNSEVLCSNFSGLKSLQPHWSHQPHQLLQPHWPHQPIQPYFIKELPDSDGWMIPGTKMAKTGPFLLNGSSKSNFFTDFSNFSVGGFWGQPMLLFWKWIDDTQISKPPEATGHHNSQTNIDPSTPQSWFTLHSSLWDTL